MTAQKLAYLVAAFDITDPQIFSDYVAAAVPVVHNFGGKVLSSDRSIIKLEGECNSVAAVLEFPSMKVAQEFYDSPEYAAVKQLRLDSTSGGFLIFSDGM